MNRTEWEHKRRVERGEPTGPSWKDRWPSYAHAGCGCNYCKWHRGEIGGLQLVMCSLDWDTLSWKDRQEIAESVTD